jgi:hypothetical protein
MRRLYKVRVEVDLMVIAEDANEAEWVGGQRASEEAGNGSAYVEASLVRFPGKLGEWATVYPYGGDGEKTCAQVLAETEP